MSSTILFNQEILDNLKYFIDKIRLIRNELLNSTDKYLLSDYPISVDNLEKVKTYRTDLRNYMNTVDFLSYKIKDLPKIPSFIEITIVPTSLINIFPNVVNNITMEIIPNE
jgi:hypothetical protein